MSLPSANDPPHILALALFPENPENGPPLRQECERARLSMGVGPLHVGVHRDVEVTDVDGENRPLVTQVFCSALPVAYTDVPAPHWAPFASLVLEAAYEATLCAAALNAQRGASNIVLLTSLRAGAVGNPEHWVLAAVRRALRMVSPYDLDVRLVSYGTPSKAMIEVAKHFGEAP